MKRLSSLGDDWGYSTWKTPKSLFVISGGKIMEQKERTFE